jgi:CheY-like chemotaxis protein
MELKQILIVDEQFPMLDDIQRLLQDWGYSVVLAPSAVSAADDWRGHPFDLILVSLNGYEEDKLNLLRRAKKNSPQARLIVLGYAKVILPMDVFQIRVDDYILPPFTVREVSTRVVRCHKSNRGITDMSGTKNQYISSVYNLFKQEILSIHHSLLSLKDNFDSYVDEEITTMDNGGIDKIYDISNELNFLIAIIENILHNMLSHYNDESFSSMGKILPLDFFKTKIHQLH